MADTLANVTLPRGVWVDLYTETGIAVGTQIIVQNLVTSHARLHTSTAAPTGAYGFKTLPPFEEAINDTGDTGAWALSTQGGAVNVREA
jgi:hypothetical protein